MNNTWKKIKDDHPQDLLAIVPLAAENSQTAIAKNKIILEAFKTVLSELLPINLPKKNNPQANITIASTDEI